MIGWWLLIALSIVTLTFYALRTWRIRYAAAADPQTPIQLLLISGVLMITGYVGLLVVHAPLWLHLVRVTAVQIGMALSYAANVWIVTGHQFDLRHSRWFWPLLMIWGIASTCAWFERDNLALIFHIEAFTPTLLYYLHYGLMLLILVSVQAALVRIFWRSLRQSRDVTYRVRRGLGFTGVLAGLICQVLISLNLVLSIAPGMPYRQLLNQLISAVVWLVALVPISGAFPQPILRRLVAPLERWLAHQHAEQQALLRELHQVLVMIAPRVQLYAAPAIDHRIELEISDARQIIWSQRPGPAAITVANEAAYIEELLRTHTMFDLPGSYPPPPLQQRDVHRHNLALARYLRRRGVAGPRVVQ